MDKSERIPVAQVVAAESADFFHSKLLTPPSSQTTKNGSGLKTVRETELYGGVLSSALTREHLFLNAEFLRGDE